MQRDAFVDVDHALQATNPPITRFAQPAIVEPQRQWLAPAHCGRRRCRDQSAVVGEGSESSVILASALSRWIDGAADAAQSLIQLPSGTLAEVLEALFRLHPRLRGYVMDEQGVLRHHVTLFIDSHPLADKRDLSLAVADNGEVYIMQALSGG